MIRIDRGAEPPELHPAREKSLVTARDRHASGLVVQRAHLPAGYAKFGTLLWERQRHKCAYCEAKEQRKRNDVEHFRPAGRADRMNGTTDPGYWWLAYTWENLLFACRNCNQSPHKLDKFPLEGGDPLVPEMVPPGTERPFMLDPAVDEPADHLEFTHGNFRGVPRWFVVGTTTRGQRTIEMCGLNRDDLLTLYRDHVATIVAPDIANLRARFESPNATIENVRTAWRETSHRLFHRSRPYVLLSADAGAHLLGNDSCVRWDIDPRAAMHRILAAT